MKLDQFSDSARYLWIAAMVSLLGPMSVVARQPAEKLPRPTPEQAAWQDLELGMFIHYDMPVFKPGWDHRQYESRPGPEIFNPKKLDTDQWMEAAKAMGAKYAVLVAKHGSGFMCWQSDLYPYGMKQSPYKGGKGDIVRDFVNSCRKYGIQPGLYAHMGCNGYLEVDNPGLANRGRGGDPAKQARYAKICEGMLNELWGHYGELSEIWFDGGVLDPAKGGPDMLPILRKLQPKAIVFQGPAASIRWIGNEDGVAPYPCWATAPNVRDYNGGGGPNERKWLPGECDVPIRNGVWLWLPNTEGRLFSVDQLMDKYYRSVGHNCNLLLNANPDQDGLIPEPDMKRYKEFGDQVRRRFGKSIAETTGNGEVVELAPAQPTRIDHVITMENILEGERVREYVIEGLVGGQWKELCRGTSIGHKKIDKFSPVELSKIRWRSLKAAAEPRIRRLAVFDVRGPVRPPAQEPVGHWTFDDVKDAKAPDDAAKPAHGSVLGAVPVEGILGKALRLAGKDACVKLGNPGYLRGDFTLACWVMPAAGGQGDRTILAKERANVGENQFRFYLSKANQLGFEASDALGHGTGGLETQEALPARTWTHVAVSRDQKQYVLYLGGKAVARKEVAILIDHENDLDLLIGARWGHGDGLVCVFDGLIDDVRIYNRALAARELAPLAEGMLASSVQAATDRATNPRPASPEQMRWWREARYGLFISWGPGSLSGMELSWARRGPRPHDGMFHYEDDKTVPQTVYDSYYKQFNPTKFDARQWVKIARDAGMKYIVFTAKHHDGFSNFHTKLSDYNIANTPFHRDVLKELADACHQAGMRLGIYYSPRDWHHPDYLQGDNRKYREFYAGQIKELLSNYGKVDILWFDGTNGPQDKWDWQGLLKMIYRLRPGILLNDRYGGGFPGDFYTPEQAIGAFDRARPWESCVTLVDGQWAWRPQGIMQTLRETLGMLLAATGGDGNLLLNVGPMPTGEMEPRQAAHLRVVGDWLKQYSEAVYGTRGGPYISGRWGYSTCKDDRIYLHLAGWDTAERGLPAIDKKILSARLLGGGAVAIEQSDKALTIRVPPADRKEPITVVEFKVDGPAIDIKPIGAPGSGSLTYGKPIETWSNGQRRSWWHNPCGPQQAVDDSLHTRWRAEEGATKARLQVNLGAGATFDRAMIDDDGTVTAFEIQAQVGQQWKTVYSGKTIGKRLSARFEPVTAQQVRLNILEARETPSIWEFQVYGRWFDQECPGGLGE